MKGTEFRLLASEITSTSSGVELARWMGNVKTALVWSFNWSLELSPQLLNLGRHGFGFRFGHNPDLGRARMNFYEVAKCSLFNKWRLVNYQ